MSSPRTLTRLLLSLACLLLFSSSLAPSTAFAAPPCLSASWDASVPTETVIDVPPEGPFAVPAVMEGFDGLMYVTFDVVDSAGTPITGTISYNDPLRAVLWTPDVSLTPGETYTATVFFDNTTFSQQGCGAPLPDISGTFDVTIRDGAAATLVAPVIDPALLTETPLGQSNCCTSIVCGPRGCEYCWIERYEYAPTLELTITNDFSPSLTPYVYYQVERRNPDGTFTPINNLPASQTPTVARILFQNGEPAPYCARFTLFDVSSGESLTSEETCLDTAALMPVERLSPEDPDLSQCEDLVMDGDPGGDMTSSSGGDATSSGGDAASSGGDAATSSSGGQDAGPEDPSVAKDDDCACQVRTTHPAGPRGALALFIAFGLIATLRRRARG